MAIEDVVYWDLRYIDDQPYEITYKERPINADEAEAALRTAHLRLTEWDIINERNGWLEYALKNGLLWVDRQKAGQSLADVAIQLKADFPDMLMGDLIDGTSKSKPTSEILLREDQSPLFSTLIDGYLKSKAGKDVSQRKLACDRAISYIGDKPVNQYDRVDAIDIAKAMDAEGFSNKRIKTIISYIKGLRGFNSPVQHAGYVL